MEQQNLDFLKDKLKYSGFDTELNEALEAAMKSGKEEFQLDHSMMIEGRQMDFELYFKKSMDSGRYFFNKYDATLEMKKGPGKSQTFYTNQSVSAKEAFNLLQGRAVHKHLYNKDGERYQAWLQVDFTEKDKHNNYPINQYHENYGYNLMDTLKKLPIKELGDNRQAEWLQRGLEKGNRYQATMEMGGVEQKVYLEANPRYKTVNIVDENGKAITKEQMQGKKQEQAPEGTKKTESQSETQSAGKKKQARKAAKKAPAKRKTPAKKKGVKV